MNKKNLTIIAVLVAIVAIATGVFQSSKDLPKVALVTLMSHPALDQVEDETLKVLQEAGYVNGESIDLLRRNANGQPQLASSIAQELIAQDPELIIAVTTPMAQAVVKNARCPVVFAAVTDPVGAGIVSSLDNPPLEITGTSDAWPYRDQLALIREISPDAKNLGVLYNPGEAASQYGIKQIKKFAPEFGFQIVEGSVSTTNDVLQVAQSIAPRCDALFLSSDNTVIGGVAAAFKVAVDKQKPLFVGDSGTVKEGGLAAVSVGYAQLGRETGRLAVEMLEGERSIPVVVAKGNEIFINLKAAEMMGVTIPPAVLKRATMIYQTVGE